MEWFFRLTTEFKFACPVCGQHITTGSTASGRQMECPTCFQKIVVPQAPASGDTKLILSAAQVHPRFHPEIAPLSGSEPPLGVPHRPTLFSLVLLAVIGFGALLLLFYHHEAAHWLSERASLITGKGGVAPETPLTPPALPPRPGWSLDLAELVIPDKGATGRVHGRTFTCQRATLTGGRLSLRQGTNWPPDLAVSIHLFAPTAEGLGGKTVEVTADRVPPLPRVVVRWKNEKLEPLSETISNGYALKLNFGAVTNGRMPGNLYLCLPDPSKSYVAGAFDAEIRKRPRETSPTAAAGEEAEKP